MKINLYILYRYPLLHVGYRIHTAKNHRITPIYSETSYLTVVTTGDKDHCSPHNVLGRDLAMVRGVSLEHEHVPALRYRAYVDGVKNLVTEMNISFNF